MPGGHAPGMKSYLESAAVKEIAKKAMSADKPVGAICHGVLILARAKDAAGDAHRFSYCFKELLV